MKKYDLKSKQNGIAYVYYEIKKKRTHQFFPLILKGVIVCTLGLHHNINKENMTTQTVKCITIIKGL